MERVPVMSGLRCLELANPARVARLLQAPNATAVMRRKDRKVVEIQLRAESCDEAGSAGRKGNAQSYSFREYGEQMQAGPWALKRIDSETRGIFTTVVDGCLAA